MSNDARVYRYGLLPPTLGAEIVSEQISLAHRYQNTLIEIERTRREAVAAAMGEHPKVETLAAAVESAEAELLAHLAAVKARRGETRKRALAPGEAERAAELRQALRDARAALKAAKTAARDDPELAAELARINAEHKARAKAARASCGVYWGTYLLIEQAMDAARKSPTPPRFRRWTGEGAVGVQIQGGMSLDELLSCDDTRLRLDLHEQPVPAKPSTKRPDRVRRGGKWRPRVRLRVGSTEDRDPIWAEWPVILHRPLPADSRIKAAKVVRRRVEAHDEWSLHITLEIPETSRVEQCGTGVVAVDLGWRRENGTLRAGGWTDGAETHDIFIEQSILGELTKAEEIRSIRDKTRNEIQVALVEWRANVDTLPEEHAERLQYLPLWQSPARFARLALWWREHRTAGDEAIFERLEAWRKRDKHLWLWETHARRGALARRRDQYRVLAAQLARRYGILVIERLDLRAMAKIPEPDSERESNPVARSQRHSVAPSELRSALVQAFRARGGRIVTVPPTGPASALLAAYREHRDDEEMPVTARVSRFSRIRAEMAKRAAERAANSGPLENGGISDGTGAS